MQGVIAERQTVV